MKKRLILMVLCVFSCMMLLAPYVKYDVKAETAPSENTAQLRAVGEDFIGKWVDYDFSLSVEEFKANYPDIMYVFPSEEDFTAWYASNVAVVESAGKYLEMIPETLSVADDGEHAKVEAKVKCEDGEAILAIHFDLKNKGVTFTAEKVANMVEKMEMAALNTAFGMFFIFAVLIFISLVIKALSILPKLFAPKADSKKETVEEVAPAAAVVESVAEDFSEEELTAVMTAAIMAYRAENEEAPADGLFVRSIKRKNMSGWKKNW